LKSPESKFNGPLDLSKNNGLTDLSALYISEILSSKNKQSHIKKLNISGANMEEKAGIFIGDALLANPNYPIEYLKFKEINLEETGLHRILEAANANHHIKRLNVGLVSDKGLNIMSELLAHNSSLHRLEFTESNAKL
jgi:hypothetical protein